ncbi:MAG TPA: hypothetical protein VLE02_01655 [Nitrosarchaeum sp.]|nr:hypothetical protein [Nitrosarchaeum sp.]
MSQTLQDEYHPYYIYQNKSPQYKPECAVNVKYKTLDRNVTWRNEIAGPVTMKHIYPLKECFTDKSYGHYPALDKIKPEETLYGYDLSQFNSIGKRESYHYKVYPLTHRHVREVRDYSDKIIIHDPMRIR